MQTALKNIAAWYLNFILLEMTSRKYRPKHAQSFVFYPKHTVNSRIFP